MSETMQQFEERFDEWFDDFETAGLSLYDIAKAAAIEFSIPASPKEAAVPAKYADLGWVGIAGAIIDTVDMTDRDYVNEKLVEQLKRFFSGPKEAAGVSEERKSALTHKLLTHADMLLHVLMENESRAVAKIADDAHAAVHALAGLLSKDEAAHAAFIAAGEAEEWEARLSTPPSGVSVAENGRSADCNNGAMLNSSGEQGQRTPTVLEGILMNALYEGRCHVPRGTVASPIVECAIDTYEQIFPPREIPEPKPEAETPKLCAACGHPRADHRFRGDGCVTRLLENGEEYFCNCREFEAETPKE
jgi:hypothetical protein